MRKILFIFLILLTGIVNAQQQKLNTALKKELDEIMKSDQGYRIFFESGTTPEKKEELVKELNIDKERLAKEGWGLVAAQDSINLQKIEKIISQYGYPGKSMVGEPANQSAWYVIQHSEKIEKYLPVIQRAAKNKEIPFQLAATMEDRYLMQTGREQIYGSQGSGEFWEENGKEYETEYIWPIKDPEHVNKRRKKAGFSTTVEENARRIYGESFVYKVYTLDDVKNRRIEVKEAGH
ncbi:MAG: hypothetical protein LBE92_13925 [Chryseobacterium sp.]|jgi:hypothetical protein|uniref:DUF6624 domain-containing protein n=1 Tax=Chryseobacterium sp. TaxID=1871047 RepID=UPI0028205F6D|nr:DUF6624 domain-containing protein [Chryseobacterium sp.]MDR2237215.1 hypothetical protein [Chryseobacterium sp.]